MEPAPKTQARRILSAIRRFQRGITEPIRISRHRLLTPGRIAAYLAGTQSPRLILGSGVHRKAGWLASDIAPSDGGAIYIDARRRLPFADNALDYVFAEHMVEHIPFSSGQMLMREIFRVLRPGGIFRVATPDLGAVARLIAQPDDPKAQQFIEVSSQMFGVTGAKRASFAVNRFFYWWGHRFIYDQQTLEQALREAGFGQIERRAPGSSPHAALQGLEIHGDGVGQIMNDYETMVLEATKAGPPTGR